MTALLKRLGRPLIYWLCGYEVLALTVERRNEMLARRIQPLSHHCKRHRSNWVVIALIFVLDLWLLWHLLIED